ncbi:MFS transporter [Cereibacter changlensis JA139]|uniref:MFS transporter n=3 Tax=Cereibacter changlensis TaxID=402884 RepID=A0A2T4JP04_9RHOB|nr:MFS transporter [Cereibacter changlensis]PTE19615.1 MFS transporter [Cereibacter changlensis JA139]PZX56210.1 putative MFS family arabinose efflux permease [Cereibacter changlensis]
MSTARRWPVISALGVVEIFAWGSSYYLMAVLAAPIVAGTGWPLAWVVSALSFGLACAGLASPRVGLAIARFGGRPVLAAGCGLLAAGLALIAAAPSLAVFYAGWGLIGLGMSASLYDPVFSTLGRLYRQDARSAITVLTLWGGFASTVCWPLSSWLLEAFGWRGAALTYAAIHLLVSVPLILGLVPKEAEAPPPLRDPGARPVRLAGRERAAFAIMAGIVVTAGLAVTMISVHLLTLLQARGLGLSEAVAVGALLGPAQVAARLVEMAGRGRHHPAWTMLFATGCVALGLALLALGLVLPALAILFYGAGNGIFSIARGALPLAIFGPERYPSLMGKLARPSLLAQAAAPMIGGALIVGQGPAVTLAVIATLGTLNLGLSALLLVLGCHRAALAPA